MFLKNRLKFYLTGQQGISMFLALIMMGIFLAMGLGLSAILITQVKILRGMERSIIAFYAADVGVERVLYEDKMCRCGTLGCCVNFNCIDNIECDEGRLGGSIADSLGSATYSVDFNNGVLNAISTGFYKEIKRRIEVERPID